MVFFETLLASNLDIDIRLRMTQGLDDRDLYAGLIRMHVLHHADEEPVFGQGMIEELRRHGYRIGPGTMYPLLHGLEKKGYLRAKREIFGSRYRRVYRITAKGRKALLVARQRVRELFGEMFERSFEDAELSPDKARRSPR